jgi:hypothetical protein
VGRLRNFRDKSFYTAQILNNPTQVKVKLDEETESEEKIWEKISLWA